MAILGIDIAKKKFDCYLIHQAQTDQTSFSNDAAGHKQLQPWLAQHQVKELHVCLQATGIYYEAVAKYLISRAIPLGWSIPGKLKPMPTADSAVIKRIRWMRA